MKLIKPTEFILMAVMGLSASSLSIAQESSDPTVPVDSIVEDFSVYLGDNSGTFVDALRSGKTLTYDPNAGFEVNPDNSTDSLGLGEITIALGLAEEEGVAIDGSLVTFLYGSEGNEGILEMRADGMGWGQIYQEFGFTVGEVMRDIRANENANFDLANNAQERVALRVRGDQPERPDLPERAASPDRLELPDRAVRPERPILPERAIVPERPAIPERIVRPDFSGRP